MWFSYKTLSRTALMPATIMPPAAPGGRGGYDIDAYEIDIVSIDR
jgi:hypothetical protein